MVLRVDLFMPFLKEHSIPCRRMDRHVPQELLAPDLVPQVPSLETACISASFSQNCKSEGGKRASDLESMCRNFSFYGIGGNDVIWRHSNGLLKVYRVMTIFCILIHQSGRSEHVVSFTKAIRCVSIQNNSNSSRQVAVAQYIFTWGICGWAIRNLSLRCWLSFELVAVSFALMVSTSGFYV